MPTDNYLYELREMLAAAWRRRWLVVIVSWLACGFGWAYVAMLPDTYVSTARIYVDTQTLLGPLLKGIAVQTDIRPEVAMMQTTLLSRPNLAEVARLTDLDLEVTTPEDAEKLFDRLSNSTEIEGQGKNLFMISFTDRSPTLAKSVVQALLAIFVEANLGHNRADMETASEFIEVQIEQYERKLKAAELRLAEFKIENAGTLGAGGFTAQFDAARRDHVNAGIVYNEAVIRRDQLRAQLVTIPEFLEVETPPQIVVAGGPEAPAKSPLLTRIENLERNLDGLRLRYTERHPDVVSTKRILGELRRQYQEEEAEADQAASDGTSEDAEPVPSNKTTILNTLYQQIELMLVDAKSEVEILHRRVLRAKNEVDRVDKLVQNAPILEARFIDLDRDYGVVRGRYEELLGRRESAQISRAVKSTTDTVQFRVIEPPQVPVKPSGPNRMLYLSVVLLAGLAAGVGITIILHKMEDSFRVPERLQEAFGLPVLGCVSIVESSFQGVRRWIGSLIFGMTSGILAGVYVVLLVLPAELTLMREFVGKMNGEDLKSMSLELLEKTNILPLVEGILQYGG